MTRSTFLLVGALLAATISTSARAHIAMSNPPARYPMDEQKDGPCGMAGNPPGTGAPMVLVAGEPLTVEWDEFVDHDGHFRIAISTEGDQAFVTPSAFDDFYNSPNVILDEILDDGQQFHSAEIVVPDVPCNPCSLQLIQVMYGGQFGPGSLYYQCADIVIEAAGADTTGSDSSGGPTDESTGGGDSSSEGDSTVSATGSSASATGSTVGDSSEGGVDPSVGTGESSGTAGTEDDEDGGCGCTADRRPSALAFLVLVVLVRRRRR